MNKSAQALGRLARGIPKTLSAEQREAKRRILAANRARITPASNKARMAKAWATRRAKQAATNAEQLKKDLENGAQTYPLSALSDLLTPTD